MSMWALLDIFGQHKNPIVLFIWWRDLIDLESFKKCYSWSLTTITTAITMIVKRQWHCVNDVNDFAFLFFQMIIKIIPFNWYLRTNSMTNWSISWKSWLWNRIGIGIVWMQTVLSSFRKEYHKSDQISTSFIIRNAKFATWKITTFTEDGEK